VVKYLDELAILDGPDVEVLVEAARGNELTIRREGDAVHGLSEQHGAQKDIRATERKHKEV